MMKIMEVFGKKPHGFVCPEAFFGGWLGIRSWLAVSWEFSPWQIRVAGGFGFWYAGLQGTSRE